MVERRNMLGRSLFAGLTGLFVAPAVASAAPAAADDTSEAAAHAIDRLRGTVEVNGAAADPARAPSVGLIRQEQHKFLLANRKYPDFIEVGTGVWDDIYDFHIRYQQPITATRLADGRYAMGFMFTTLILRPDQDARYIGYAFDAEPPRPGRN